MDYTLQTHYDDQFFYLTVANMTMAFHLSDIDNVIANLEDLRKEIAMLGCGS